MKTILPLFIFCYFAFVQKGTAQTATTDSATTTQSPKPASRGERMRQMHSLPVRPGMTSAPFPGEPARDARHNTRRFTLPKDLIPKVRDSEITETSDYFKPTAASTPIPEMLADSSYVKDYRYYAYNMGIRQMKHPVGTGLIIGGGALVLTAGIVAIIIALSHVHVHTVARLQ